MQAALSKTEALMRAAGVDPTNGWKFIGLFAGKCSAEEIQVVLANGLRIYSDSLTLSGVSPHDDSTSSPEGMGAGSMTTLADADGGSAAASSFGGGASTVPFAVHGEGAVTLTSGIKFVACNLYEDGLLFKFDAQKEYEKMLSFLDMHMVDLNLKGSVDMGVGPCRFDVQVNSGAHEIVIQNKAGESEGIQQCLARLKLNHIVPETAFNEPLELT